MMHILSLLSPYKKYKLNSNVIKMDKPAEFTDFMQSICLSDADFFFLPEFSKDQA